MIKTNKQLRWTIFSILIFPVMLFGLLVLGIKSQYAQNVKQLFQQKQQLQTQIDSMKSVVANLEKDADSVGKVQLSRIVATAYNSFPWQTNNDPFTTSSGETVGDGTLALSRDLIRAENSLMHKMGFNPSGAYAYGDTVFVVYVKPMIVHDTMNKRFKKRADIWMRDYSTAKEWGRRQVFLASKSDS